MRRLYKNTLVLGSAALTAVVCLTAATRATSERGELEARANRLFDYDRGHVSRLPAHKLRALSVALAFHDDPGARALVEQLERSI